jgi:serine/threonine protein phosphatase PrpC
VFNVDLSPDGIFIFPDGLKLINFTNAINTNNDVDRWIKSDIKNLANTLLFLLPKIEAKDENMLYIKSIFMNAVQGGYSRMRDFFDDVIEIDENFEPPGRLINDNKTVFLTNKGVSISIGMASDVGMVRNLNEDSVSALELTNIIQSVSTPYGLYMVADGMGGHEAGEEASKLAVEYITRKIIDSFNGTFKLTENEVRQILEEAVFSANQEINKIARLKNNNMGTTITIAYTANNRAFILNVGDARAYRHSNNKLKLITQDHSLVYRLYKIGQLTYEEIYQHPQSNQILCSLGELDLQQSLVNLAEKANHPYFFNVALERGDGLLLCTDGLWQMLPDQQIEEVLNSNLSPQNAVNELVYLANQNGGDDNISLIYVKIH